MTKQLSDDYIYEVMQEENNNPNISGEFALDGYSEANTNSLSRKSDDDGLMFIAKGSSRWYFYYYFQSFA